VDKAYAGPKLDEEDGKYRITEEFIKAMIDWFKAGKTLPKRYVWEIVLGAHEQFVKEESLVNVDIPEGVTVDVIGDVHGKFPRFLRKRIPSYAVGDAQDNSTTCYIFTH
jgi:serine/threonine-protein phosphatase 5